MLNRHYYKTRWKALPSGELKLNAKQNKSLIFVFNSQTITTAT